MISFTRLPLIAILALVMMLIGTRPAAAAEDRGAQGAHRMRTISAQAGAEASDMLATLRRTMRDAAAAGATEKELKQLAASLSKEVKAFIQPHQQLVAPYYADVMRALQQGPADGRKEAIATVRAATRTVRSELNAIAQYLQAAVREELNIAIAQLRSQSVRS